MNLLKDIFLSVVSYIPTIVYGNSLIFLENKMNTISFKVVMVSLLLINTGISFGQQRFRNANAQVGIYGQHGLGNSVGWCDIDNDGDLDIAFANQDGSGLWLYRNDDGSFTNITVSAGLGSDWGYDILWAELTGDEYSDLILGGSSPEFMQNQNGTSFTDITSGSGLTGTPLCVADLNNDGAADILTVNSAGCNILYNDGSGVFTSFLVGSGSWSRAVCFDYDLDGDQDIYLGGYNSTALFRNDGATFENVTIAAGVFFNGTTTGITPGDYNNDGFIDLYLSNYSSPGCRLYKNKGDGTFSNASVPSGTQGYTDTRLAVFNDYNNDGWLDIFSSHHDIYVYGNLMWRNDQDGTFTNVAGSIGLWTSLMQGDYFGTAWGDYNLDGDVDLFVAGHRDEFVLYRNDQVAANPSNYVVLELEGTTSNRDAIGARVTADLGSITLTRTIQGGEGAHGYQSLPIEFGLYDVSSIQTLEINWPSGLVETYTDISANQYVYAVEGDGIYCGINNTIPQVVTTLNCWPNPCNNLLTIGYSGANGATADIEILDLSGRVVKNVGSFQLEGSNQSVIWDVTDNSGKKVPAGIYLCRLSTETGITTSRVTVLR